MAHPKIESYIATAVGRAINPDNAFGLQCVDVADDYAEQIFGLPWQQTIGGVNGARDLRGRTNAYFTWIDNVVGDESSIPARGDLAVWDGDNLNPYGHVALVIAATADAITCIQQDGFLQTPAHVATNPYVITGAGPCLGWLRPNLAAPAPEPTQRVVGGQGVTERSAPAVRDDTKTGRVFVAGDTLNFKGFERGETANGTDVWFVGAFSGTYFSASAFDDQSTNGLPDLTPTPPTAPPALSPTQRFAGPSGVTKRAAPDAASAALDTYPPGETLNFKGWTRGKRPYGLDSSDVWLVGISDTFIWSGAVVDGDKLDGLPEIVLGAPATESAPAVPAPAPVAAYTFPKRFKCTTEVRPAHPSNFMRGNFPARPEYFVIHQMDDPAKRPTLDGMIGWFQTERRSPTSAHLGAQGPRFAEIVDLGDGAAATGDRAYHASTIGNNYIGLEVPPNPDAETVETVKRFLREWRDTRGYELKLKRHMEVPGNNTTCGTYIDLALFDISGETPAATAPAPSVPAPAPVGQGEIEDFVAFLVGLYRAAKK
jgi:hypothetical protein